MRLIAFVGTIEYTICCGVASERNRESTSIVIILSNLNYWIIIDAQLEVASSQPASHLG